MNVHIATSRPIGAKCIAWAKDNLPGDASLVNDPGLSDVFISVMYDRLIEEDFISKRRCYNFHPGILPQYRGSGAFSWAIINGDTECGITLHELDVDIDHGPIIDIQRFPIGDRDTAGDLFAKGMVVMFDMFTDNFARIVRGQYSAQPQDESQAAIYYRRDLRMEMDLTRHARAFAFSGKDFAFYVNQSGRKIDVRWQEG